jgi:hypothetical protein
VSGRRRPSCRGNEPGGQEHPARPAWEKTRRRSSRGGCGQPHRPLAAGALLPVSADGVPLTRRHTATWTVPLVAWQAVGRAASRDGETSEVKGVVRPVLAPGFERLAAATHLPHRPPLCSSGPASGQEEMRGPAVRRAPMAGRICRTPGESSVDPSRATTRATAECRNFSLLWKTRGCRSSIWPPTTSETRELKWWRPPGCRTCNGSTSAITTSG